MSKKEEKIEYLLQNANIKYVREKTFTDLGLGQMRFDFYLPELNYLIEYDSMLHFKQIPKFHKTRNSFLHAQENDRRKNSFALARNITLFRIPEWEFDNIKKASDLFQKRFCVTNKWWNDIIYRNYLKGGGSVDS